MKLELLTNLSSRDSSRLGLDLEGATEGKTVDVSKEAGEELIKRGWATEPKPEKLKAVPAATDFKGVPSTGKP